MLHQNVIRSWEVTAAILLGVLFCGCWSLKCFLCGIETRMIGGLDASKILNIYPCPQPFNSTDTRVTDCRGACRKYTISRGVDLLFIMRKCVPKCTTHTKVGLSPSDPDIVGRVECCTTDLCNSAPPPAQQPHHHTAVMIATALATMAAALWLTNVPG